MAGYWIMVLATKCWPRIVLLANAVMLECLGKVNSASAFLLLVNYVSPASAFRYQGRVSQVPLHGYG